ncbi:MAG: iron-containing alcohol dehydrogenase [Bacteroidales bacterium]|nr:iron-containing alcohol dehydrogenase [Bacteroidales bacterium]
MSVISMHSPRNITFGPGCTDQMIKDIIASGKKRIYILSAEPLIPKLKTQFDCLSENRIVLRINTSIQAEPAFADFERIIAEARDFMPDAVVGIGGGSVMDMAKLIAAFIGQHKPVKDYIGTDLITERKTHLICAATTSGTGSEVSPNSIIIDETENAKKGFVSPYLIPDAAYIDPVLTLGLSPLITAYTGMDALTHCIEAYANRNAHPLTDTLALQGISLISRNLITAVRDSNNLQARTSLALGSLYGGMCLGPVSTAAVHALAYPLGCDYNIPHGLSNSLLLPYVMEFNLHAAEERYASIARATGITDSLSQHDLAVKGIEFIRYLIASCNLPAYLHEAGIHNNSIEKMALAALEVKRLVKNNVRELNLEDVVSIYQQAF